MTPLPPSGPLPGELPEPFYAGIGVIVVRWATLEEAANLAIAGLLKLTFTEMLPVLANLQGQTRFNILQAVAEQTLEANALKRLLEVLKPVRVLIGDRNKVVHGAWRSTPDENVCVLLTSSARGKLTTKGNPVSLDKLITLGNSIGIVKDNLVRFLDAEGIFPGLKR